MRDIVGNEGEMKDLLYLNDWIKIENNPPNLLSDLLK